LTTLQKQVYLPNTTLMKNQACFLFSPLFLGEIMFSVNVIQKRIWKNLVLEKYFHFYSVSVIGKRG